MIIWYFCRRFLSAFLLVLVIMTSVLSAVNVVGKNIFLSSDLVVALFLGALPFMAVFVYPFALLCGCLFISYATQHNGEALLIDFFPRLRRQLATGFFFTSLIVTVIFVPLVLWFAPRSYDWGKQFLYTIAEQRLVALAPGFLHFPLPGVAVYFENIQQREGRTIFNNFFLIQEKTKAIPPAITFAMWGDCVVLSDKKLLFHAGSIVGIDKKTADADMGDFAFTAAFEEGVLDLEKLFGVSKKIIQTPVKYQTIQQLWASTQKDVLAEQWRRYIQILWVFLTPLLAYLLSMTTLAQKILSIIFVAGGWFFILYIILLMLSGCLRLWGFLGLYLLFLTPILITIGCYYFVNYCSSLRK
jgi:lipopolysaccharide export LptBFGC system permease protein LptF